MSLDNSIHQKSQPIDISKYAISANKSGTKSITYNLGGVRKEITLIPANKLTSLFAKGVLVQAGDKSYYIDIKHKEHLLQDIKANQVGQQTLAETPYIKPKSISFSDDGQIKIKHYDSNKDITAQVYKMTPEEVKKVTSMLTAEKNKLASECTHLDKKINSLEEEEKNVKTQINTLKADIEKLEKEILEIDGKINSHWDKVKENSDKTRMKQEMVVNLANTVLDLEQKILSLKKAHSENVKIIQQKPEENSEVISLSKTIDEKKAAILAHTKSVEEKTAYCNSMKGKERFAGIGSKLERITNELKEAPAQLKTLQAELATATQKKEESILRIKKEISQAKDSNEDNANLITMNSLILNDKQNELRDLRAQPEPTPPEEIVGEKKKRQELENKISDITKNVAKLEKSITSVSGTSKSSVPRLERKTNIETQNTIEKALKALQERS